MHRRLFLLGGSPAFAVYADKFVQDAGGTEARRAALVGSAEGWQKFIDLITLPWKERGVTQIYPIMPDVDGSLDINGTLSVLQNATGIFIGGGYTPVYHRLYASGAVGEMIQQCYAAGVPVAGVSAGALISMEICQLVPDETGRENQEIVKGLCLAQGYLVGVHFTEWNTMPEVEEVMRTTGSHKALGIDEPACAVFEDGVFVRALGQSVHEIQM